ncbi:MAG TPA: hypothetical protein V6C65_18835 [Allocoleopsis sp.]
MSRRKSVAELTRQLEYARLIEAAQAAPVERDISIPPNKRPKVPVDYEPSSPFLDLTTVFLVQASGAALADIDGQSPANAMAVLYLSPGSAAGSTPPKGFKYNSINWTYGQTTPTLIRAQITNRPYIRYTRGARGDTNQHSFKAPINIGRDTTVATKINNAMTAIAGADNAKITQYGRISFEPERVPLSR